jgi:hypothetical protein
MTGGPNELSAEEFEAFQEIDAEVRRDARSHPLRQGARLKEIKDRRLWRSGFATWAEYCDARLGGKHAKRTADRYIAHAKLAERWDPGVPFPPTERHGRPFVPLDDVQRREAAARIPDYARLRAEEVEAIVKQVRVGTTAARRESEALVLLAGRGEVTLSRSGIPRRLDVTHRELQAIAALGPHAIFDAIQVMDDDEARRRALELEADAYVIETFLAAIRERYPEGVPRSQTQLAVMLP